MKLVTLAALGSLACLAAASASAAPQSHHGHSMLGASDRAAAPIRAAEARLIAHLEGENPLAWVSDYTKDAVFQEGEDAPVSGRAALTELARSLGPLSGVRIDPVRTEVSGNLAYVQVRGAYAVGKGASAGPVARYRGVMIWRRDSDGVWRMLHEMLAKE
jgi:ketosteroid isomerase-like protein